MRVDARVSAGCVCLHVRDAPAASVAASAKQCGRPGVVPVSDAVAVVVVVVEWSAGTDKGQTRDRQGTDKGQI